MYIAYSWPKVLSTAGANGQYISVHLDQTYFVAVSEWSVQVWSGGQVRLRLGQHIITAAEAEEYGQHVCACWSSDRSCLAALTSKGWLLIYHLHTLKDPVLPRSTSSSSSHSTQDFLQSIHQTDVYIKHAVPCQHDAAPTCVCCDARTILVAYADGYTGSCSWTGKMRNELFDILPDVALSQQAQPAASELHQHQQPSSTAVTRMHYSEAARLLAVVFADGSAALYGTGSSSSTGVERQLTAQLDFRRWLCGPAVGATSVQIAPEAQLIALGDQSGAVHLLDLHPQPQPPPAAAAAAGSFQTPAAADSGSSSSGPSKHLTVKTRVDTAPAVLGSSSGSSAAQQQQQQQGLDPEQLVRTLDLSDWGHTVAQTGAVAAISWAPDCRALAVGFSRQGLVVWTPSGCRLICTLRQPVPDTPRLAAAAAAGSSDQQQQQQQLGQISVDGGVSCLAWGISGYQLMVATAAAAAGLSGSGSSSSGVVYELSMAKSLRHHHRVSQVAAAAAGAGTAQLGEELHVMQAADRLLLVTEALTSAGPASSFLDPSTDSAAASSSDLLIHHVLLPGSYLAAAWPIQHVAVSRDGADIAVAGRQGLAVFNRRQEKWRLFGDVSQERRVSAVALGWLQSFVVTCSCSAITGGDGSKPLPAAAAAAAAAAAQAAVAAAAVSGVDLNKGVGAGFRCQLLLFPKSHLDFSSVVATYTLSRVPVAMDCTDQHILLVSAPLQLLLLQLEGSSSSGAAGSSPARPSSSSSSSRRLIAVRELSMFNVSRPVSDIALVTASAAAVDAYKRPSSSSSSRSLAAAAAANSSSGSSSSPCHAVILRWGGLMSVLDLCKGAELVLSSAIESFWLSDTLPVLPAAAAAGSSRAGSTSASASHSRTSSVQNLAALAGSSSVNASDGPFGQQPAAHRSSPVAAAAGGSSVPTDWSSAMAGNGSSDLLTADPEAPEVVEMPWWAYGPAGMQLWFPSVVLAAMQAHTATAASSSSSDQLQTQASLPAQLSPQSTLSTPRSSAAAAAIAAAAAGMKHAQSAPMLAQQQQQVLAAAAAAAYVDDGSSTTEMELEFDREVYPIGVSLADSSIVGVTQRVLRPHLGGQAVTQAASPRPSSSGSTPIAAMDQQQQQQPRASFSSPAASQTLSLPCFVPIPESQPVLPALLRRLLQQGALREALALAARHEGGPHFRRSLEWLLFTTLDMEAPKCKLGRGHQHQSAVPGVANAAGAAPAGAYAGVLGRQGKGWQGHVDKHILPVPVTPLLSAAVDLVLSFRQCLDVVVSVSRKTDASLWPALFSAVGSPAAITELLLDNGALSSAACFLIVVDRLEGADLAQDYALTLMRSALKKGQYFLCAEILRFLIPPRESSSGVVQWGPAAAAVVVSPKAADQPAAAAAAELPAAAPPVESAAAAAAGSSGWLGWLWSGSKQQQQPQQQQQQRRVQGTREPNPATAAAAAPKASSQAAAYRQSLAGKTAAAAAGRSSQQEQQGPGQPGRGSSSGSTFAPGAAACKVVADRGWLLLEQGKLTQLVQLIHSMQFLTGGLAAIMTTYRPAAAAAVNDSISVDALLYAVMLAVNELPVWESSEVEQDATLLLDLVRSLQLQKWSIALAVLLVEMSVIGPFAAQHADLWADFCQQLLQQPELYFLHEVVGALAAAGSGEPEASGKQNELEEDLQQQA